MKQKTLWATLAFLAAGSSSAVAQDPKPVCETNGVDTVAWFEEAKQTILTDGPTVLANSLEIGGGVDRPAELRELFDQIDRHFPDGFDRCLVAMQRREGDGFVQEIVVFQTDEAMPQMLWAYLSTHVIASDYTAHGFFVALSPDPVLGQVK